MYLVNLETVWFLLNLKMTIRQKDHQLLVKTKWAGELDLKNDTDSRERDLSNLSFRCINKLKNTG